MSRVRARRRFGALTASLLAALLTLAAAGGGSLSGVGGCAPADRAADRSPDNTTLACATCRLRGEMKAIRLAAIREHVLAKLDFSQAPNTTGRVLPAVPQDMLAQLYERERERSPEPEMQGDEPPAAKYLRHRDVDRDYATTDRIIAFPQRRERHKGNKIMYYRFTEKTMDKKVTDAHLHIKIKGPKDDRDDEDADPDRILTINVQVSRAPHPGSGESPPIIATFGTAIARSAVIKGTMLKINLTGAVAEWFALPREPFGLIVKAQDSEKRRIPIPEAKVESISEFPYLELYVEENDKVRVKRTIGLTCSDDSRETRCCKYPLTVNFEEFGWDWVIAPKKYEASFCMGECPYAFMQRYPNTHVVHLAAPAGYGGPCCTPRKMSHISLLHFDHEFNIILETLSGMVVEHCGCN